MKIWSKNGKTGYKKTQINKYKKQKRKECTIKIINIQKKLRSTDSTKAKHPRQSFETGVSKPHS